MKLGREVVPSSNVVGIWSRTVAELATFQDRGSERWSTILRVTCQVSIDGECTCALAKNCDFGWITSKSVNVLLYPPKSKTLVKESKIVSSNWKF
jgi:hypothetical protein